MLRSAESGWQCVCMHDLTGRRGVWYRRDGDVLELCAGREGDDWYVRFVVGEPVTAEQIKSLHDCLGTGHWMFDAHCAGVTQYADPEATAVVNRYREATE